MNNKNNSYDMCNNTPSFDPGSKGSELMDSQIMAEDERAVLLKQRQSRFKRDQKECTSSPKDRKIADL